MITLDCSLVLNSPPSAEPDRSHYAAHYLQSQETKILGLRFDDVLLQQLEQIYAGAIAFACEVVEHVIRPAGRVIDFELSVDETEETTSAEAHYYIANELRRAGVEINSLAPRFVGEFQKAVDYMGNLEELKAELHRHAQIADVFGYKLSLHSASEKFSTFPNLVRETRGRCHVKTSGTSWLEAVECIAKADPALYRDMHKKALKYLKKAKKSYVVSCDPACIPALESLLDGELPLLLEMTQSDSRQLMHITYGYILADEGLKKRIYAFMEAHRALYEAEALDLYRRHLELLR